MMRRDNDEDKRRFARLKKHWDTLERDDQSGTRLALRFLAGVGLPRLTPKSSPGCDS